jgi:hypothetical protein
MEAVFSCGLLVNILPVHKVSYEYETLTHFKSWLGHQLSWLKFFKVFLGFFKWMMRKYLQLGHDLTEGINWR